MAIFQTKKIQDTQRIVRRLLPRIKSARIIFLTGELGGGKTFFVKCLAKELKIKATVVSPTFQLAKEYQIVRWKKKLIHIDLYRLGTINGWRDAPELKDYFENEKNLVMVEWGEKLAKLVQPDLAIKFLNKGNRWQIQI